MSLPFREKQRFFLQLAQLLRSGIALPAAAEKLMRTGSGAQRQVARLLHRQLERGATAPEAFAALTEPLGAMERSCLSASARTGRLEYTLRRLAEYFGVLHQARSEVLRHSAYPLFVLHFGLLVTGLPTLLGPGGPTAFLQEVGTVLLWMYAGLFAACLVWPALRDAGAVSGTIDGLLRSVPLAGRVRRDLSVARFFGTYDMQLDAGVNVIDSLLSAAEASRSGLLHRAVKRALPDLRSGETVGPLLEASGALPSEAAGAVVIAEETGELHHTLPQLQEEYERSGLARLQVVTEWLPRLLYLAVAGYVGWKVVGFFKDYFGMMMGLIDS